MTHNSILKKVVRKVLWWAMRDVSAVAGHPLNGAIYLSAAAGRPFDHFVHPQVAVGEFTYGIRRESFTVYHPNDQVVIGRFCSIADGVRFIFGEHDLNHVSTFPFKAVCFHDAPHADARSKGQIEVGHDVWIGANAIILSGTRIGHGAVIGAAAVVTRDVPPYAVVTGVPARVVRYRLPPDQIEALLQIQWWNWPIEKIHANLELFYDEPSRFIAQYLFKAG